jgi:hypothetical protein
MPILLIYKLKIIPNGDNWSKPQLELKAATYILLLAHLSIPTKVNLYRRFYS